MIRIWNYNKNRIHSYRGARYIEMSFDTESNLIFRGEIKRALGAVMEPEACSECVLFTMNESILNLIEKYDPIAIAERENEKKQSSMSMFLMNDSIMEAPSIRNTSKSQAQHMSSEDYMNVPNRGRVSRQVSFTSAATSGLSRYHRGGASLSPTRGGEDGDSGSERDMGKPHHLSRLGANVGGWEGNSARPLTGKKNKYVTPTLASAHQLPHGPTQDSFSKASRSVMRIKHLSGDDDENCPLSMSYDGIPDHMMSSTRRAQWNPLGGLSGSASTSRLAPFVRPSTAAASRHHQALHVSTIEITLRSNWGDSEGIGLTGLSALDDNFEAITLPSPTVVYKDRNGIVTEVENSAMSCSPDVLIDNENLTSDSAHMWYTTILNPSDRIVSIRFDMSDQTPVPLRGLNIWNYNGSNEEALKGAKHVEICLNGTKVIPAVLRKALGDDNSTFEYAQFLHLTGPAKGPNELRRHNSTHKMETVQDSPVRLTKSSSSNNIKSVQVPEELLHRSSSPMSTESASIVSLTSPFDDSPILAGRFSPIQGVVSKKKPIGNGGEERCDERMKEHPLIAPTAGFDFRPTNCIVAQQYETPVRFLILFNTSFQ